jgi:hypothetical protein
MKINLFLFVEKINKKTKLNYFNLKLKMLIILVKLDKLKIYFQNKLRFNLTAKKKIYLFLINCRKFQRLSNLN